MKLIDAEALADAVEEKLAPKQITRQQGFSVAQSETLKAQIFQCILALIEDAPRVSANDAMAYYYEERDREYAERMDDAWKSM